MFAQQWLEGAQAIQQIKPFKNKLFNELSLQKVKGPQGPFNTTTLLMTNND
jgi:hypothetical protein